MTLIRPVVTTDKEEGLGSGEGGRGDGGGGGERVAEGRCVDLMWHRGIRTLAKVGIVGMGVAGGGGGGRGRGRGGGKALKPAEQGFPQSRLSWRD